MIRLYTIYTDIQPRGRPAGEALLCNVEQGIRDRSLLRGLAEVNIQFPMTKEEFAACRDVMVSLSESLPAAHHLAFVDTDNNSCAVMNVGSVRIFENFNVACQIINDLDVPVPLVYWRP